MKWRNQISWDLKTLIADKKRFVLVACARKESKVECLLLSYPGNGFGHFAEDSHVPGLNFGLTHLLMVGVEPQIVRAVAPHVVLISTQVQVPHTFSTYKQYNYNY